MSMTANLENDKHQKNAYQGTSQNAMLTTASMALTMAAVNGIVPGSILPNSQFQFLKSLDTAAKVAQTSLAEFMGVFGQNFLSSPATDRIVQAARQGLLAGLK